MINVQVIKIRYGFMNFSMAFRESSIAECLFYRLLTFLHSRNTQFRQTKSLRHTAIAKAEDFLFRLCNQTWNMIKRCIEFS